jgi:hypothetical protein
MARGVGRPWPDDRFEGFARRVFAHQFATNALYRSFCEGHGVTPTDLGSWTRTPVVPVSAFKVVDLVCGPKEEVELVFRTSGTTRGPGQRGLHYVPDPELYRASLLPSFRAHLLPDLRQIRFVSLVPSREDAPDSSLSFMVDAAAAEWASEEAWVVDVEGVLDSEALAGALREAREAQEPVLLLGTAFALLHALERTDSGLGLLPAGSRIMETGGFKGRSREVSREELHGLLSERTGVPRGRIVNEYGMTELLSQLYEPVLSEGRSAEGVHRPPPWLRVRALDPTTLAPLEEGAEGLLAFFDLANVGSVSHVLTEDIGSVRDGDVRLVGRVRGAEPRGCSRAMDELMSARR